MGKTAIGTIGLMLTVAAVLFCAAGQGQQPVPAAPANAAAGPSGDEEWEITPESAKAVELGLEWLAKNQGPQGNWNCRELGLVSMGALAFLSAGYTPDKGKYGHNVRKALDYVISNAKPSGLLNIAEAQHDMYNHGLSTFVLTQAYGMTRDPKIGKALDKAIKLICVIQGNDGGWSYQAVPSHGGDLSLVVMQAKALRGAMDIGLDIPQQTIKLAIAKVRKHYWIKERVSDGKALLLGLSESGDEKFSGRFTYQGNAGGKPSIAMASAGAVCLQEFGQYDDFRIIRSLYEATKDAEQTMKEKMAASKDSLPLDPYTLYYLTQALYQVGGKYWRQYYPIIRDNVARTQIRGGRNRSEQNGSWQANYGNPYATAVAVFVLTIPNRFLPILQEAPADSLAKSRSQAGQ
ncbi:MAG: squalene--hopene cyclase [Planctomycetes bacterium]|nr:squalene--hopene cyclase [Planctomycetota bacterium]